MLKRFRIVGLCLVAVMAVSAFGAVAAQATPVWVVPCHKVIAANKGLGAYEDSACSKLGGTKEFSKILLAGETVAVRSMGVGNFILKTANDTITCSGSAPHASEENTGTFYGGEPGTNSETITFYGCKGTAGGANGCTASTSSTNPGVIGPVNVNTFLAYPKGAFKGTAKALVGLVPAGTGNVFATFKLEGSCLGAGQSVTVEATGTEIGDAPETETASLLILKKPPTWGKKKCGLLGEAGKLVAGSFVVTKSGETAIEGALNAPATAITEGEVEVTAGVAKLVKCGLKTTGFFAETATESGVSKVEVSLTASPFTAIAFGWEV